MITSCIAKGTSKIQILKDKAKTPWATSVKVNTKTDPMMWFSVCTANLNLLNKPV